MTYEFTPEQEAWIASRPPAVQAIVRSLPPDQSYRLRTTGQQPVYIDSYEEPISAQALPRLQGRITLKVTLQDACGVWIQVFGVRPEDLEPTLPGR